MLKIAPTRVFILERKYFDLPTLSRVMKFWTGLDILDLKIVPKKKAWGVLPRGIGGVGIPLDSHDI